MAHVTMTMNGQTADALKMLIEMLDDFCNNEDWCRSCPTRKRCDKVCGTVKGSWSNIWNEIEKA